MVNNELDTLIQSNNLIFHTSLQTMQQYLTPNMKNMSRGQSNTMTAHGEIQDENLESIL